MKILIVDDEPLVRKSLGRAFRAKGHDVVEAVDGIDGMNRWSESSPELVLLDVLMPGLSGPELLKEMHKELRKTETSHPSEVMPKVMPKVILMSAYAGEHATGDVVGRMDGVDLFVAKPFEDVFALVALAEDLYGRERSGQKS